MKSICNCCDDTWHSVYDKSLNITDGGNFFMHTQWSTAGGTKRYKQSKFNEYTECMKKKLNKLIKLDFIYVNNDEYRLTKKGCRYLIDNRK